jgi:hypothetical protein
MPPDRGRADDGAMTDKVFPGSLVAGPGFTRAALGLAWVGSWLATATLVWAVGAPTRSIPLCLALLGLVASGAVASNKVRVVTLAFSTVSSAVFVAGGVVTAALAAAQGAGAGSVILAAVVPVVGGVVTFRLTDRAREMSR